MGSNGAGRLKEGSGGDMDFLAPGPFCFEVTKSEEEMGRDWR